MKNLDVKIVELKPMRVLSFYGYGHEPEDIAWENLAKWVKETNFTIKSDENRIFGFNNPCPAVGSSKYGYEFLISIDSDVEPEGATI